MKIENDGRHRKKVSERNSVAMRPADFFTFFMTIRCHEDVGCQKKKKKILGYVVKKIDPEKEIGRLLS